MIFIKGVYLVLEGMEREGGVGRRRRTEGNRGARNGSHWDTHLAVQSIQTSWDAHGGSVVCLKVLVFSKLALL